MTSIALAVLILLVFIGMTTLVYSLVSAGLKRTETMERSSKAFLAAQSRVERAKALIMSADSSLDSNSDGIVDGRDNVAGNWVTLEDSPDGKLMVLGNLRTFNSDPSLQPHYLVRASGVFGGAYRAVEATLGYLSFLKFARFTQVDLNYGGGAVLTGMVYAGGNITVPSGPGGPHVIFKRDVITRGELTPKENPVGDGHTWSNVVVEGQLEENSSKNYTLNIPQQFAFFKAAAQSAYGLYVNTTNDDFFATSNPQVSGSVGQNLIELNKFKNLRTANAFYDSNDDGDYDVGTDLDLPDSFNGIVWWEGANKVHVKGDLTGQSISIISDKDIYIDGSISTGTDVNGMPVNLGLVSDERIFWSQRIHSIFHVDAALFCSNSKHWGSYSAGYGTEDTDYSSTNPDFDNSHGAIGETANPPWYFKIYGPIITKYTGDNGGWIKYGEQYGVTTREFVYDVDITTFPPPFPVVEGVLQTIAFREIDERI